MITVDQIKHIAPLNKNPTQWCDTFNNHIEKYDINTPLRVAALLAQCAYESGDFINLYEDLNYRPETLMHLWPSQFPTLMVADEYKMQPQKIANYVYANRMGNGNESSGDGWKYRGRGLIQLTGKSLYTNFANYLKVSVEDCLNYIMYPDGAVESACWFWKTKSINTFADKKDINGMTKAINGGLNGLANRKIKYQLALDVIK
jgi:putative chitinase